jgi:uncharacterized protein (DUF1697 family)
VPATTYIALFRGINVGSHRKLPMSDLRAILEKCGCADVRTYIQSGNAILCAAGEPKALAKKISGSIAVKFGFEPRVLLLTLRELERAAAANPFAKVEKDPTRMHLFFLAEEPARPDLKGLEALKTGTEKFALKGRVFYMHTPDGFGVSKLATKAEQLLGVDATARNWRTVTTLLEMTKA